MGTYIKQLQKDLRSKYKELLDSMERVNFTVDDMAYAAGLVGGLLVSMAPPCVNVERTN